MSEIGSETSGKTGEESIRNQETNTFVVNTSETNTSGASINKPGGVDSEMNVTGSQDIISNDTQCDEVTPNKVTKKESQENDETSVRLHDELAIEDLVVILPDELANEKVDHHTLQNGAICEESQKPHSCDSEVNAISNIAVISNTDAGQTPEGAIPKITSHPVDHNALQRDSSQDSLYHVKWIRFQNKTVPIIMQNENGPCPLLAVMNVLMLQEKVCLPNMLEIVSSSQLMEYLGDQIFDNVPKDITDGARLNYEQNMQDALAVLPKLQTGLDVNVKFTSVNSFEYTPECILFDLLRIHLYHGWLIDPESPEVQAAVGQCSYNQLVEKVISQKSSDKVELVQEAYLAENFLERTAAQLTYYGLAELNTCVKENELCVLFRNNHFSTMYKNNNELFILVTDQGFLTETNIVWETLSNVEGDCHFVSDNFVTYRKSVQSQNPVTPLCSDQQTDQDYLVALSLQEEQDQFTAWQEVGQQQAQPPISDHQLALQLQQEEERASQSEGGARGGIPPPSREQIPKKKKKDECTIL